MTYPEWDEILKHYQVTNAFAYPARYNIAPKQDVPVIVPTKNGTRKAGLFRWGLIPAWADREDTQYNTINARAETLRTKPAFKHLVSRRRAAILSDGWYEWKKPEKQPYRIVTTRPFFAFAGLFDVWRDLNGQQVFSCTIITCPPSPSIEKIHNRMPVVLRPEAENIWLDPHMTDADELTRILTAYPDDELRSYPVDKLVGNVKNDDILCIHPAFDVME